MAKGKSKSPVVINKNKFLLPKMEWFPVDDATGEGFYVRELSGRHLLEFKEKAEQAGKGSLDDNLSLLALLMLRGACDSKGLYIFTEDDLPLLAEKSPMLLKDVAMKVLRLSGVPDSILNDEVTVDLKNDQPSSSTTESLTNSVSL